MDKEKHIELTDAEIWLRDTMVWQMDELVHRLKLCPCYQDLDNDWYNLKEKLGLANL